MVMQRHIGLIFRDPRGGCSCIDTVDCSDVNILQQTVNSLVGVCSFTWDFSIVRIYRNGFETYLKQNLNNS